jgi:hypothetical protein
VVEVARFRSSLDTGIFSDRAILLSKVCNINKICKLWANGFGSENHVLRIACSGNHFTTGTVVNFQVMPDCSYRGRVISRPDPKIASAEFLCGVLFFFGWSEVDRRHSRPQHFMTEGGWPIVRLAMSSSGATGRCIHCSLANKKYHRLLSQTQLLCQEKVSCMAPIMQ